MAATPALDGAVTTSDERQRLELLLVAWRELRHPRIADLVDRLTARLLDGVPPLKAASVPARVEAVAKLCDTKDAVDVGRVLGTEWPGTWKAALPMLRAVLTLPDDPRVAKELARQVDLTRFETWTSSNFYRPLFAKLNALGDARQLPLLEAQLTRTKSEYYQRDMRPLEEAAVEVHRRVKVQPLSTDDDALVTALEAPFAVTAAGEKSKHRSGEELLTFVFDNPGDVGARAVYGDWLSEHGDPRGELISLQLGAPSEKSTKRQAALIKKHWKTWLGPIADWFRAPPTFEAGFPCEGSLYTPSYATAEDGFRKLAERPEWSTFRRLALQFCGVVNAADLVRRPRFSALRELDGVDAQALEALLETRAPLTRLGLTWARDLPPLPAGAVGTLSALEHLTIPAGDFARYAPGLVRLKRLTLQATSSDRLEPVFARLTTSPVEVVELDHHGGGALLTRASPGAPFLHATLISTRYVRDVLLLLPAALTSLSSEGLTKSTVPAEELAKLQKTLGRFEKLTRRDLPFELQPVKVEAPHVSFTLSGVAFFEEAMLAPLWKLLTEDFGVPLDTLSVRGGLALGNDPVGKLTTWCKNPRCHDVTLEVKGASARFPLLRRRDNYTNAKLPRGDPERFIKAFDALLAFAKPTSVAMGRTFEGDEVVTRRADMHAFIRDGKPRA